jgi:hypothetical protein
MDLGHAQGVAGGQEVGVVAAEGGRRHDDGDLLDARRLRGDDRHQQRRGIRRRPARDADPDPPQRAIAEAQLAVPSAPHHGVAVEDARLERQDVVADPSERAEIGRIGCAEGVAQFLARDPHGRRLQHHAIEPGRVVEHGVEPAALHVGADPLDDLLRCQRLAEGRDGPDAALRADHVPLRAQLSSQP